MICYAHSILPLIAWCSSELKKMLSIRVAEFLIISSRVSTKCIIVKPDWRVRFHTICQKQGLIMANLTFVFSVLKFGIPLMTHLNLRVVLVSKIS